jgi:hypothetical protein
LLLVAAIGAQLLMACESGPQIVDYGPQRGSSDVPTNTPVQITFDHAVDRASVARRFHVLPASEGRLTWPKPNQLVYVHAPLQTDAQYTVELEAGYQDTQGHAYSLRHWWQFQTESPPELVSISPAPGTRNVDPAAYVTLTFSREMNLAALGSALSLSPAMPFSLRVDPGDDRRVIVAPRALLDAAQTYSVKVSRDALDVDGNPLRAAVQGVFETGADRSLRHWVGVLAQQFAEGAGRGVWVVDENRFPRQVSSVAAEGFSWAPDGQSVLLQLPGGKWSAQPLGGKATELPFQAGWAAVLGARRGYVYLENGQLNQLDGSGDVVPLASGVDEAALAPDGDRLAYTIPSDRGTDLMAMEVDLRARYRLQVESQPISGLAWSPDGLRLAYRVVAIDATKTQVRVRSLTGAGGTLTVALGDAQAPRWLDGSHLVFAATVSGPSADLTRAFRVSALSAGGQINPAQGLPATGISDLRDPAPSPDGHQVAFLSNDVDGQQVWLMNADGTGLVQLTDYDALAFPYSCVALAWTPS